MMDTLSSHDKTYRNAVYAGIGLGKDYLGITITGDPIGYAGKRIILINPYAILHECVPEAARSSMLRSYADEFAGQIVSTILHEITHVAAHGHGEEYAIALTHNTGHLASYITSYTRRLGEILATPTAGGTYYDEFIRNADLLRPHLGNGAGDLRKLTGLPAGGLRPHAITSGPQGGAEARPEQGVPSIPPAGSQPGSNRAWPGPSGEIDRMAAGATPEAPGPASRPTEALAQPAGAGAGQLAQPASPAQPTASEQVRNIFTSLSDKDTEVLDKYSNIIQSVYKSVVEDRDALRAELNRLAEGYMLLQPSRSAEGY